VLSRLRASRTFRRAVRRFGVHRAVLLVGLAQLPLLRTLEVLLRRFPRDRGLVAMGSPLDRFADNAAYLYAHLAEHPTRLRVVWLSGSRDVVRRLRSLGYRAETRWSWRGVWAALRAGTFVYSAYRTDVNRWLSPGATAVCLWHGLPIKRVEGGVVGSDAGSGGLLGRLAEWSRERPPDYLLSSSPFVTSCFSAFFGVPAEHCWELGYPRNDHLVQASARPPAALVRDQDDVWERLRHADRVIGLFATWRDDRAEDALDERLVADLARACTERGAVLAYKAHYNVAGTTTPPECVVLPPDADLHAYLGLCDLVITDYSSISVDFLLTGRPVVYFMPDLEHYAATRGFAVDPLRLPGVVTRDRAALLAAVAAVLDAPDPWTPTPADERFLRQMWGEYDGHAAAGLGALLESTAWGRTGAALTPAVAASPGS
jgi:CDP-glycerol glycerophosphotransferase